jgi:hypothetical protein
VAAVVVVVAAALGLGTALGGGDDDEPEGSTAASGDSPPALASFEGEDPLDAPDCDPETGRLAIPTLFAPNCVPLWPDDRDNGGATSPGVTEDEIIVARYVAQEDESATAITDEIAGEDAPTDEENAEYRAKVLEYYNGMYRYMSDGQRYMPGEVGESAAVPFDEEGTSLLFDGAPDADVPPTYPRRTSREG